MSASPVTDIDLAINEIVRYKLAVELQDAAANKTFEIAFIKIPKENNFFRPIFSMKYPTKGQIKSPEMENIDINIPTYNDVTVGQ